MWAVCLITEKSVTFCIERQFSLWKIIRHLRKVACWKNSGVKEEKDTFFIHHCLFAKSGEGNGIPLQYSCLENPLDRGAWKAAVHGVPKSRTRLSDFTLMHWRRKWQPTPVFLPGESQGRGSLVSCRLWGSSELNLEACQATIPFWLHWVTVASNWFPYIHSGATPINQVLSPHNSSRDLLAKNNNNNNKKHPRGKQADKLSLDSEWNPKDPIEAVQTCCCPSGQPLAPHSPHS